MFGPFLYIIIQPPLSLLFAVVLLVLLAGSLLLLPIVLGLPILMVFFLTLRQFSNYELKLANLVMVNIPNYAWRVTPEQETFLSYLKAFLTTLSTYSAMFWFLIVRPVLSMLFFVTTASTISLLVSLIAAPLTYLILPPGEHCLSMVFDICLFVADSLPMSLFFSMAGLFVLPFALLLVYMMTASFILLALGFLSQQATSLDVEEGQTEAIGDLFAYL
ncbi:hypothetical protein RCL1_005013 [Eukaryota sp. TZLM3-RCL]